jgi:hypothetical protein
MLDYIHCSEIYDDEKIDAYIGVYESMEKSGSVFQNNFGVCSEHKILSQEHEDLFSSYLWRKVTVIESESGHLIRPHNCAIQHQNYKSMREWYFSLALEDTTFNIFYNKRTMAKTAIDSKNLNFRNILEWDYEGNILLKRNCGIFYRPWLFHSFERGLVHHFKMHVN